MLSNNNHQNKARSLLLVMIMVLSTTVAIAGTGSASIARSYTTQKDPLDIAIADFNCDGHNDMAIATDGTHTITVLWNDGNGDFSERSDICKKVKNCYVVISITVEVADLKIPNPEVSEPCSDAE